MNENRDLNQRENGINPSELSGKGDYYFSNGVQERTPAPRGGYQTQTGEKRQRRKSTYVFFIVVIAVSMALSVYAVFCMNDIWRSPRPSPPSLCLCRRRSRPLRMPLTCWRTRD